MFEDFFELKGLVTPKLPSVKKLPLHVSCIDGVTLSIALPEHDPKHPEINREFYWLSRADFESGVCDFSGRKLGQAEYIKDHLCTRYWKLKVGLLGRVMGNFYLVLSAGKIAKTDPVFKNLLNPEDFFRFAENFFRDVYGGDISRGAALAVCPVGWQWLGQWGACAARFFKQNVRQGGDAYGYLIALNPTTFVHFNFFVDDDGSDYIKASVDRQPIIDFMETLMTSCQIERPTSAGIVLPAYEPERLPIMQPLKFTTPEQDRFASLDRMFNRITEATAGMSYNHQYLQRLLDFRDSLQIDWDRQPEDTGDYSVSPSAPLALPPDLEEIVALYEHGPHTRIV